MRSPYAASRAVRSTRAGSPMRGAKANPAHAWREPRHAAHLVFARAPGSRRPALQRTAARAARDETLPARPRASGQRDVQPVMPGERHLRRASRTGRHRSGRGTQSTSPAFFSSASASANAFSRCGSSRSAGTSPISPYTCASADAPSRLRPRPEIHEPQRCRTKVRAQLWRERLAHIAHRRKRRDDERHRRHDALVSVTVAPRGLHRTASPCRPECAMPSAGQSSSPTARSNT